VRSVLFSCEVQQNFVALSQRGDGLKREEEVSSANGSFKKRFWNLTIEDTKM